MALTLLVTQYNTKQQIEKLNKLKSDTYDEQSHLPTDLQQMRLEIISLKTEIDSLKNWIIPKKRCATLYKNNAFVNWLNASLVVFKSHYSYTLPLALMPEKNSAKQQTVWFLSK